MRRLDAAVKSAIAVAEIEAKEVQRKDNAPVETDAITITFNEDQSYRVPWGACRTWRVGDFYVYHVYDR